MNDTAYDRLRDYAATYPDDRLSKDIKVLLREVDAHEEFGGNFQQARRRMMDAIKEGQRWFNRATDAEALVATFQMGVDGPLWRRIAGQRREIKVAWWYANVRDRRLRDVTAELRALKDA